ncbi:Col-cuticle-N domain-containing protein [Aphelenchoides bicaudatus]|nr:Col-cuticle-N domain-containing protein [Aphelenchoides bicaudatus]
MYNNIQTTIDYAENEMRFCERSNREALVEVELGRALMNRNQNRTRRGVQNYGGYAAQGTNPSYEGGEQGAGSNPTNDQDSGYGNDVNIVPSDSTGTPIESECPGCCIPGPPGARGPSGKPGTPLFVGSAGKPGIPGLSPNQTCPVHAQREPPACRPCPKGAPGIKGWPGFPGDVGPTGAPGEKDKDGEDGAVGEPGPIGPPFLGFRGSIGSPGDKGITPSGEVKLDRLAPQEFQSLASRNGVTGAQGERGWPGNPGESGETGYPGREGGPGLQGPTGEPGVCVCQNVDSVILVGPSAAQPRIPEAQEVPYSSAMGAGGYGLCNDIIL